MEPTFRDGDCVLVERRSELLPGEIGIFRLADGDGLIKEYRPDGLHSHNPAYAVRGALSLDGTVCLGHVLGAVTPDLVPDRYEETLLQNDRAAAL